jgi:hypothetical protein
MDATDHAPISSFINYPTPKAHDIPYKAPPEAKNPVVKGLTLQILAYA